MKAGKLQHWRLLASPLAASLLLFAAGVLSAIPGNAQAIVRPDIVTVPVGLSRAAAFSLDWTYLQESGDTMVKAGDGHIEVRQTKENGAISYLSDSRMLQDVVDAPLARPESVTVLFTPGHGLAYNAARDMYVRRAYKDPLFLPAGISPWGDRSGAVALFALGQLHLGTDSEPQDGVLDGRPVRIYTTSITSQTYTQEGKTFRIREEIRYYFAGTTGLPIRYSRFLSVNSAPLRETSRVEVTACTLLSSLPDSRLTLEIPKTAKEFSTAPPEPKFLSVGTPAPDFTCIDGKGRSLKLSDLKGKVVVLDFWATWCAPCQAAMPHLQKIYEALKDRSDVAVLALCVLDEKAPYEKWRLSHRQYTFPVAFDPAATDNAGSIARKLFQINGIPAQYVIDRAGRVAAATMGLSSVESDWLENALAQQDVPVPTKTKKADVR